MTLNLKKLKICQASSSSSSQSSSYCSEKFLTTSEIKIASKPSYSMAGQATITSTISTLTSQISSTCSDQDSTVSSGAFLKSEAETEIYNIGEKYYATRGTQQYFFYGNKMIAKPERSKPGNEQNVRMLDYLQEELSNFDEKDSIYDYLQQDAKTALEVLEIQRSNVLEIYEHKPFMQDLFQLIFDGDAELVVRQIRFVAIVLIRLKWQAFDCIVPYNLKVLFKKIVLFIAAAMNQNGATLFMHFASSTSPNFKCDEIEHGYCRLLTTFLRYLPLKERSQILHMQTDFMGRNLMHIATILGQPCQLRAVIASGLNPNLCDNVDRAPIHYAIERRDIETQKILMWSGADISLCPKKTLPIREEEVVHEPIFLNPTTYIYKRLKALQNIFTLWVMALLRESNSCYEIAKPISSIHTIKFYTAEAIGRKLHEATSAINLNLTIQNKSIMHYFIFMMPVYYDSSDQDEIYYENPQVYPTLFPYDVIIDGNPTLLKGDDPNNPLAVQTLQLKVHTLPRERIRAYQIETASDFTETNGLLMPYFIKIRFRSLSRAFPEINQKETDWPLIFTMAFLVKPTVSRVTSEQIRNAQMLLDLSRSGEKVDPRIDPPKK